MPELSPSEIDSFIDNGFLCVRGAFSREVAARGCEVLWPMAGVEPETPATWTKPVVRIAGSAAEPFVEAVSGKRLLSIQDELVGAGRWLPRRGLGTFPIRFPHVDDPGDAGWHVDGGYLPPGADTYWLNLESRGRALLMLFLFTDVGFEDAPTRIKVGSHLDVPRFLQPAGEAGMSFMDLCTTMNAAGQLDSPSRAVAYATGMAGDVYLCHPFLVHAAQRHRGSSPRIIAQPPLEPAAAFNYSRADDNHSPVELAVRRALGLR